MSKYRLTATLSTPDYDGDDEFEPFVVELTDKAALFKVQRAFLRAQGELAKITEKEVATGKKAFVGTNPQLTVLDVVCTKTDTGARHHWYQYGWPGQTNEAREFLRGMLEGIFKEAAFPVTRGKPPRGRGRRA